MEKEYPCKILDEELTYIEENGERNMNELILKKQEKAMNAKVELDQKKTDLLMVNVKVPDDLKERIQTLEQEILNINTLSKNMISKYQTETQTLLDNKKPDTGAGDKRTTVLSEFLDYDSKVVATMGPITNLRVELASTINAKKEKVDEIKSEIKTKSDILATLLTNRKNSFSELLFLNNVPKSIAFMINKLFIMDLKEKDKNSVHKSTERAKTFKKTMSDLKVAQAAAMEKVKQANDRLTREQASAVAQKAQALAEKNRSIASAFALKQAKEKALSTIVSGGWESSQFFDRAEYERRQRPKCPWTAWSDCSKSCAGGTQERARIPALLNQPACNNGGETESRPCNTQACPKCDWSPWGTCSKTCGGGTQSRVRVPMKPLGCLGAGETDSQSCNTQACPMCQWGPWGTCSKSCDGGTKTRTRLPMTPPGCKGGGQVESASCNTQACPKCNWGVWGACSKSCGGGTKTRTRLHAVPLNCKGGGEVESASCNTQSCPKCNWGPWGACSKSCGGGTRTRTRIHGSPWGCTGGGEVGRGSCNTQSCPKCNWGGYGGCSRSCGGGTKTKTRQWNNPWGCTGSGERRSTSCNTHSCCSRESESSARNKVRWHPWIRWGGAGNYTTKGLYWYSCGKYKNTAWYGRGGSCQDTKRGVSGCKKRW